METSSTIIGVVLLLVFMSPILIAILKNSSKEKKRLHKLEEIAKKHGLSLSKTEVSNLLVLGLDAQSQKMIVVEPLEELQYEIIDISRVKSCTVLKESALAHPGNKVKVKNIGQVVLEIREAGKEKSFKILFYDEDANENMDMQTQYFKAENWRKFIQNKTASRAA